MSDGINSFQLSLGALHTARGDGGQGYGEVRFDVRAYQNDPGMKGTLHTLAVEGNALFGLDGFGGGGHLRYALQHRFFEFAGGITTAAGAVVLPTPDGRSRGVSLRTGLQGNIFANERGEGVQLTLEGGAIVGPEKPAAQVALSFGATF